MTALLHIHPSRAYTLRTPDTLTMSPDSFCEDYIDAFGNRARRFLAPAGKLTLRTDAVVADTGELDLIQADAPQLPVLSLPTVVLRYLLASRYCDVDLMSGIAWQLFGGTAPGWARVQAVCDWVHANVRFDYMQARATRTAQETYNERVGVCRDFQHLAITFCRCLNIPARYATGYLGDIRIEALPGAMDFSAWFEAYLGDRWYTFDARFNTPRVGRVLVSVGCDAVDAALTTIFGAAALKSFQVWGDEVQTTDLSEPRPRPTATSQTT